MGQYKTMNNMVKFCVKIEGKLGGEGEANVGYVSTGRRLGMEAQDSIVVDLLQTHSNCTELALHSNGFKGWCSAYFDGITCWPPTESGQTAIQNCPPAFRHSATVTRICEIDGTWSPENKFSYSPCGLEPEHISAMRHLYGFLRAKESKVPAKWYLYHRQAECLDRMTDVSPPNLGVCPMLFDGWSCWDYTLAGDNAYASCPKYITGFDSSLGLAFRTCTENGSWFEHPATGRPWSNYTTCVDVEDLHESKMENLLSLKCTRIAIHIHLFVSFALNNLMWIIWYRYVVGDLKTVETNEDDIVMRWFYFVGWVLPAVIAVIYAAVRYYVAGETEECWMEDSYSTWLLTAPVLLSMLANMVFLINVVRVLLTKLHPRSSSPAPRGMRKAVRATLILVPLFGLHHILLPFRPEPRATGEILYQVFSAVVVSLQGFCVASLFCFANVDVHSALRNL
ncbi:hypothetical protein B566_EDAN009829, partial [Ephemera danica]